MKLVRDDHNVELKLCNLMESENERSLSKVAR